MNNKKHLFFIASTDKKQSIVRKYTDALMAIFNQSRQFGGNDYTIETHVQTYNENLHESLKSALKDDYYEGYLILLDTIDESKPIWNPNVMYEFGAITGLDRPFAVLDTGIHETKEYPFDISEFNVAHVPNELAEHIKVCFEKGLDPQISDWFLKDTELHKKFDEFCDGIYHRYINSYEVHCRKIEKVKTIHNKLDTIIKSVEFLTKNAGEATAKYIDGEAEAFTALYDAVKESKVSLRTTRFANESIVRRPTPEQRNFMNELYATSQRLKENFVRIICNNDPSKWQDIFQILMNGGNNSRVYVRKDDFSIHFELVIIDDDVTFVHFYQADNTSKKEGTGRQIERLNSTLKIQGSSICKKFAKIYDRLHHRDFEETNPHDPSRTLLGIPMDIKTAEGYEGVGYFEIKDEVPAAQKSFIIMRMFKSAFHNWKMDDKDRINMAVGIALIEMNIGFIEDNKKYFSEDNYEKAIKLYNESLG